MKPASVTIKGLEVFLAVARTGSIQNASRECGISLSTVSHHLSQLERSLGVGLVDHGHRPLNVTPAGALFERDVAEALRLIRKAEAAIQTGELSLTRDLSIAMIEDFDTEVAPELARRLTGAMPRCRFRHLTRPSHEILDLLRRQKIQVGIAARPQFDPPDLLETPILRDPFVIVVPASWKADEDQLLSDKSGMPFLRYSSNQIIASQIEAHLRRLKHALPHQYEFESNQTLMRLVAEGEGWSITTPLNYLRAQRFHGQVRLAPFPDKGSARTLSVFTTELTDTTVGQSVTETFRRLLETRAVRPTVEAIPWLADQFRLLPIEPH